MSRDLASLGYSLAVVDEIYEQYLRDPSSVESGFRELFSNGHNDAPARAAEPPRSSARRASRTTSIVVPIGKQTGPDSALSEWPLIQAYRAHGHQAAQLDPLGLLTRPRVRELEAATHGFSDADRDVVFDLDLPWARGLTLAQVEERLRKTYSGSIGIEFSHISNPAKKSWIARRMEADVDALPDEKTRVNMLKRLIRAEMFESFCHTKFPGTKRFSLEGSESLVPLLNEVLVNGASLGVIESVIGMAHRGRLNLLTGLMGRRPRFVFSEFQDINPEATLGSGDVKYHVGYSHDREDRNGRQMHLSLTFNPSHLEAVDPVVAGRVRAKQVRHGDWAHEQVLGIQIHGDAAFAGQGLVAETLQLSNLHGYRTGGTVHIIVNNQIGFTASPREYRSTPYCTDIAKMIQCPIWHVNGEDLDAVGKVVKAAMEYRAQFHSDVVIDMFCYRKYGHNEMDEPSFTNPVMYQRIQTMKPVDAQYGATLVSQGVITRAEIDEYRAATRAEFEDELNHGRSAAKRPTVSAMAGLWSAYRGGLDKDSPEADTGVSLERLRQIGDAMTEMPEDFRIHRKVARLLEQRRAMGRGDAPIDWGCGELLAYGSLLWEGTNVRLSGQDTSRGTFSHRHAVSTDIESGTEHLVLGHLHPEQGEFRIYDSPVSEAGVLGFEFGYSLDYPDALVAWEAQFGDFANGAQVIIDQFIVASEDKWNRLSGVVLLLPHGFEGQGPEHSSARIERFLQMCAEDNIQVTQPSTPAQMFHLVRRQVHRRWRKPLVVFTPKSLLRLPAARSAIEEFTSGTYKRVIDDGEVSDEQAHEVKLVLLCTGRVYYDILKGRAERERRDCAIIRLEQLYPWPGAQLEIVAARYPNAKFVWVQDEPENMGAWEFVRHRLAAIVGSDRLRRSCREASASPATGSGKAHAIEQRALLRLAFDGSF